MNDQKRVFIVSAPSGAGKTTLNRLFCHRHPNYMISVSYTTRAKRDHEIDGQHYTFMSIDQFKHQIESGKMLEWAEVHGHYYGTSLDELHRIQALGAHPILEIDVQGWHWASPRLPDHRSIFVLPPSMSVLLGRLKKRGSETPESLERRFKAAIGEIQQGKVFDRFLINDRLEDSLKTLENIILDDSHGSLSQEDAKMYMDGLVREAQEILQSGIFNKV